MLRNLCLPLAFAVFMMLAPCVALTSASADPAPATPDLKAALAPRSLGDPKAPVKVDEYASLSCPHCARFSKNVFDAFKAKYIDTGEVFYTYHDFPLNKPALEATMVARCLPADHYFQFTKFLFDTQDRWADVDNYDAVLRGDAKLLGMSDAEFNSCINDTALRSGIVGDMQADAQAKKIEATPTFIINGMQTIEGEAPLTKFEAIIDPLLGAPAKTSTTTSTAKTSTTSTK